MISKTGRKLMCFLCVLAMTFGMMPGRTARADEEVSYISSSWEGTSVVEVTDRITNYGVVSAHSYEIWGNGAVDWYVVNSSSVNIDRRVTVRGTVHLILCDGACLTVTGGITVASGNTLTIHGQSGGTGKLYAGVGDNDSIEPQTHVAGIGGEEYGTGGTVNIHGGTVTAKGGFNGAGIGGGSGGAGGTVNIYGGIVTAYGGDNAAGIGGGYNGAGIGGGYIGAGGTVNIYGGTVTAYGGDNAAGIGGGGGSNNNGSLTLGQDVYAFASAAEAPDGSRDPLALDGERKVRGNRARYMLVGARYPVTFDKRGHGDDPLPYYAIPGGRITDSHTLSEAGWIFGGWYTSGGTRWNFETDTVNGPLELHAEWTEGRQTPVYHEIPFIPVYEEIPAPEPSEEDPEPDPVVEPSPDPAPDPSPDPAPEPGPAVKRKEKTEGATVEYKGEKITVSANMTWDGEVTYTGGKIKPSDVGYELDLSDLYDEVKVEKGDQKPEDLFEIRYVNKNNVHKSASGKKASFYAKIKLNEQAAKEAGLSKEDIERLKAVVDALNEKLKNNPCRYKVNPVKLSKKDTKVTATVKWKGEKISKVKSIRVTAMVNGEEKTFRLKPGQYKIKVKNAAKHIVTITGKGDFKGTITVKLP